MWDADWRALCDAPSIEAADNYLIRYCNSVSRPLAVLDLLPVLFGAAGSIEAWRWLADKWDLFDVVPHRQFREVFRLYRKSWSPACMSLDGKAAYKILPTQFRAYRGQRGRDPLGLSWTLDRSVAEQFAYGHRGIRNSDPVVFEADVKKSDVALMPTERREAEIVLFATPPSAIVLYLTITR